VYFSREDLNLLLSLFSRQVIANQWLDYTIDTEEGFAAFCVYRRAHETPLYRIFKLAPEDANGGAYVLMNRMGKVKQADSLGDVLAGFEDQPTKTVRPVRR